MHIAPETEVAANLHFMHPPELHFPYDAPFQIKDGFNGPENGTWWFHSWIHQEVYGPFHSREQCQEHISYVKDLG